MWMIRLLYILVLILTLTSCSSFGTLGVVTKSSVDSVSLFKSGGAYQEIGPARGRACRTFFLGIIPYGDSSFSTAVDRALEKDGGNALINVAVSSNHYGFFPFPLYYVLSFTCTTVQGIAVKFQ